MSIMKVSPCSIIIYINLDIIYTFLSSNVIDYSNFILYIVVMHVT